MPVVSQNVSDLPSIMCSGGYFGSAEDAKLTDVPAELKPISNIFAHTVWNLRKDFFILIEQLLFFSIATLYPYIKLAVEQRSARIVEIFAIMH